jgi:quinol monooxygenase YgiN
MATVLFMVKIRLPKEIEGEFNKFYEEVHVPDVLAFPGAVSFRRYRAILGEDHFQLLSAIEFKDEAALQRFLASDYRKQISDKIDARWATVLDRQRSAWEQVWP